MYHGITLKSNSTDYGSLRFTGRPAGDVPVTYADSAALERDYGFTPRIGIREGLKAIAEWYAGYYGEPYFKLS